MPGAPVQRVRPSRVSAVQVLHPLREPALGDVDDEMEMVRHQAIRQDDPLPASRGIAEKDEKVGAIVVFPVERLAVVATAADVVDPTGFDFAQRTSHDANVAPPDRRFRRMLKVGTELAQTLNGV